MGVGQGKGRERPGQKDVKAPQNLCRGREESVLAREPEEEGTVPAGAGSSGRAECAARVARQWDLVPV